MSIYGVPALVVTYRTDVHQPKPEDQKQAQYKTQKSGHDCLGAMLNPGESGVRMADRECCLHVVDSPV